MTQSLGYVAIYVALAGVASFIEKPAGRGFGAFQLNALLRTGSLAAAAVAVIALAIRGPRLPMTSRNLGGLGVGVMIGSASEFYFLGLRGLPVSVAAASSNASVVVTVVLSAVFLHQAISRPGRSDRLDPFGATLLAMSTG